jgi:hypothetical protein
MMNKPFWDPLQDDLDIALYSEVLVTAFRFLPEEQSLPLFSVCANAERSEAVKTVAVRACLTLAQEVEKIRYPHSTVTDE